MINLNDFGNFSDDVDAAALEAYRKHIAALDGVADDNLILPDDARDMFIAGFWAGVESRGAK